ncbi:MAG: multicopper oxidase domain-containing protein [Rhodobacteraceae bacterium]|nr:multicopper oxidase domain-containing protein [Paracoccaceae bacterium]
MASNPSKIDRRNLFKLAGASGASAALSGSVLGAVTGAPAAAQDDEIIMRVMKAQVDPGAAEVRTYNGVTPGRTLVLHPGGDLRIHLINELEPLNDDCPEDHNTFHGLNTTNFHTHGLHVSPGTDPGTGLDADNIFLNIVPKGQQVPCWDENFREYENHFRFEIPGHHPPGTHWYHAHKHGSTAMQVVNGMCGPLIIPDPAGHMPAYIENAPNQVFVIQRRNVTEPDEWNTGELAIVLADAEGGGVVNPTIQMKAGEVRRWRFINASPNADSFVSLSGDSKEIELWQIAFDGLTLPKRVKVDPEDGRKPWMNHASLAPGNRTDLMVKVSKDAKPGRMQVHASPPLSKYVQHGGLGRGAERVSISIDIIDGKADDDWDESDNLPGPGLNPVEGPFLRPMQSRFYLNQDNDDHLIDGKKFDGKVKHKLKLNSADQWTVYNENPFSHPFHIHVNPFFVTHINGEELPRGSPLRRWQDTVALPGKNDKGIPGSIHFNTRYTDFTGKFVLHCHILHHEDLGMMQAVAVV